MQIILLGQICPRAICVLAVPLGCIFRWKHDLHFISRSETDSVYQDLQSGQTYLFKREEGRECRVLSEKEAMYMKVVISAQTTTWSMLSYVCRRNVSY